MNTKQNEFIIGITVSLATLMVIVGLLWMARSLIAAGKRVATSQFGQIQGQLQQVLANLENMSSRENITLVRSALLHLNRTTAALDSLVRTGGPVLLSAVNNVNEISAENKEAIQSFMASLQKNSQSLAAVLERTHQSASRVDSLLSSIQRGQGNLGRLYSSDSLYIQLEKALTNIDSLFQDIRNHPGKYFNVRIF
ncbi:MAG: hypothetical protein P8Y60_16180 [Calditrichota bacterium]